MVSVSGALRSRVRCHEPCGCLDQHPCSMAMLADVKGPRPLFDLVPLSGPSLRARMSVVAGPGSVEYSSNG